MIIEGEIGTLSIEGVQVGGILGWEMEVDTSNISRPRTYIVARGIWLFGTYEADKLELTLYKRDGNKLPMMLKDRVSVITQLGDIPEDTLVYKTIEMEVIHGEQVQ